MSKGFQGTVKINWGEIQSSGPAPLEEGVYRARFEKATADEPTQKGDNCIRAEVTVFEDAEGNPVKRTVRDMFLLTEKSAWKLKGVMDLLELELPDEADAQTMREFCGDLCAASQQGVYVRVGQEEYTDKNGNNRVANRISRYLSEEEATA